MPLLKSSVPSERTAQEAAVPGECTEEMAKRQRKANFSDAEVRILLGEIQEESVSLFSNHSDPSLYVSNAKKKEIWERIAAKINTICGVARRSAMEVREKWRALKSPVLNKKKDESNSGDVPATLPYEDIILAILSQKSDAQLGLGERGEDENNSFSLDRFEEEENSSGPSDTQYLGASRGGSSYIVTNATENSSALREGPPGMLSAETEGEESFRTSSATENHHDPLDSVPVFFGDTKRKRKMLERSMMLNSDNSELVDEWLKCHIDMSKAKKRYYELKSLKIQLELKQLEKNSSN